MTDYTAAEVLEALNSSSLLEESYDWAELEYTLVRCPHTITLRGEEVPVNKVAADNGGDWGYETFIIIKVGDQLFRKTGFYQSHYGNDWDGDFTEVYAVEKTITVYVSE